MWKTVVFLLITIVVVPFFAFRFDEPLNTLQQTILVDLLVVYLVAAGACFVVSVLSQNYSQVDKLWSIIPIVYAWMVFFKAGFEPRLLIMASLVTIWGLRLTFNFNRRGGYSVKFWTGEEDYRWEILRGKPEFGAKWKWTLFNFLFISFYQMGLILLMTLPILKATGGGMLTLADGVIALVMLGFIIIETIADQQQWNYHKEKHRLLKAGEELPEKYKKGFVSTGLWGIVRHPNYAAEQAIWIVFYFFSVISTGIWLNWSVMGAILLVLLFFGSSNFSESISASKYEEYADYKRRVPRFIPIKFRR